MTLTVGSLAPRFNTTSDDGTKVDLHSFKGEWVVLFFYPKASSGGCSIEAGQFESLLPEFKALNTQVIGISADTEARQAKFRHKCKLSYPLIPDGDKTLCKAYGVMGGVMGWLGVPNRQTFIIHPSGHIAYCFKSVIPIGHAAQVLAKIKELQA